jgi:hypothetical protein
VIDAAEPGVLMVPGFTGSGPGHWHSLWQRDRPRWSRVEQRDWDRPEPIAWETTLDETIRSGDEPVVLAAHSLGCVTVARWAGRGQIGRVAGAFLVAPSDVEAPTAPREVVGFAPIPLRPLPFPAVVVASADDPLVSMARARLFADAWGAQLITIGNAGHINTASGHGPWPEGLAMLLAFLDQLAVADGAV